MVCIAPRQWTYDATRPATMRLQQQNSRGSWIDILTLLNVLDGSRNELDNVSLEKKMLLTGSPSWCPLCCTVLEARWRSPYMTRMDCSQQWLIDGNDVARRWVIGLVAASEKCGETERSMIMMMISDERWLLRKLAWTMDRSFDWDGCCTIPVSQRWLIQRLTLPSSWSCDYHDVLTLSPAHSYTTILRR